MPPRVRALVLASLLLVCSAGAAHAATFTVTTGNDKTDTAPGDGLCVAQGLTAACTLRAALQEANAHPDADTIVLPAGAYGLANPGIEDLAAFGDLDVSSPVTIVGAGAAVTQVRQNESDRLFDVHPGGSLTISDVQLADGFLSDDITSGVGDGVGIRSAGALTVRRVWFSNMTGTVDLPRNGGGVAVDGGVATVTDSLFTDMRIAKGGGQAAAVTTGSLTLQNVTATGNTDDANGGVFAAVGVGTLTVRGATVLGNAAAAVDQTGGGTATISFTLAGGAGGACTAESAAVVTLGPGNVFDHDTPCRDGSDVTPRFYGSGGPRLSAVLQSPDGLLPPVLVPLAGSPAIDTGAPCGMLTTDARGGPRPQGLSCDAGAVEVGSLSDVNVTGAGPTSVDATDAVSDTFVVLNAGTDPSRTVRVTVAATGPGTLFGLTTTRGTCSLATRTCVLGDLAPQQQVLIRADLRAGLRGTLRATLAATHLTTERVTANDRATLTTTVKPDTALPRMRLAATTVRVGARRTATFRITCPATERTCTGTVRPTFGGRHLRTVKVALVGGRAVTLKVTLSSSLRRAIRRGSKLKVSFAVNVVDASGNRYHATVRATIRK